MCVVRRGSRESRERSEGGKNGTGDKRSEGEAIPERGGNWPGWVGDVGEESGREKQMNTECDTYICK